MAKCNRRMIIAIAHAQCHRKMLTAIAECTPTTKNALDNMKCFPHPLASLCRSTTITSNPIETPWNTPSLLLSKQKLTVTEKKCLCSKNQLKNQTWPEELRVNGIEFITAKICKKWQGKKTCQTFQRYVPCGKYNFTTCENTTHAHNPWSCHQSDWCLSACSLRLDAW